MGKTAIVFTPKYYAHDTGPGHPESPRRLKAIMKELKKLGFLSPAKGCTLVKPEKAQIADLELTHSSEHVQLVKRICGHGGGLLDLGDTVVSPASFDVARYAAGGAIKAVDLVLSGKFRNAFALVRPPGHHAGEYYAAGFCVFNNVAIAAAHMIRKCGLDRILVLDIDAHHGNGTQEIFYDTKKVLYISLHEDPREFPGTGFIDETGRGEGLGYTVNIPFPFKTGDHAYLKAIDEITIPITKQYKPQFILTSVGYDGYYKDPVAKLNLSSTAFTLVFQKILGVASTLCEDKFAAVLEGGYTIKRLGALVASTLSRMAGCPLLIEKESLPTSPSATTRAEEIIAEVKQTHSAFWNLQP
jgi:acetoin utilization deacetylase AcuC-like enzyme